MAPRKKASNTSAVSNVDSSMLMSSFMDGMESEGVIGKSPSMNFLTGIDLVDIHNGAFDAETNAPHYGLTSGRIFTSIGKSGTGKTTLQVQAAANICRNTPNAQVLHLDVERSSKDVRLRTLSGATSDEFSKFYRHSDKDLHTEKLKQLIDGLYDFKMNNAEALQTPIMDTTGEERIFMPPTVILLDSLAMLTPSKYQEEEEIMGNMSGSAIARANNSLLKQTFGKMCDANIFLFIVNHITVNLSINPMQPAQALLNYLKPNESVPGGSCSYYLSDYYLKLEAKAKLDPETDYGLKGFMVKSTVIKSRAAPAGIDFDLVLDQARGFNNHLSNLNALMKEGYVQGTGRGYFFKNLPDEKFSKKTFLQRLGESEKLNDAYQDVFWNEYAASVMPSVNVDGMFSRPNADEVGDEE